MFVVTCFFEKANLTWQTDSLLLPEILSNGTKFLVWRLVINKIDIPNH